MNLGMRLVDATVTAARMRPFLLLGPCLFFAVASFAQSEVDPLHAMAPAQLQRALFSHGHGLPAAKTTESKAVRTATPAGAKVSAPPQTAQAAAAQKPAPGMRRRLHVFRH
jgi:hypothetical protein